MIPQPLERTKINHSMKYQLITTGMDIDPKYNNIFAVDEAGDVVVWDYYTASWKVAKLTFNPTSHDFELPISKPSDEEFEKMVDATAEASSPEVQPTPEQTA